MKIAICGFYGKKNFGDDLFQSKFLSIFNENEVNFYSDCVDIDVKNYKDESFLNNDIYIIGGGNLINPSFWFFNQNIKKPIYFLNVSVSKDILNNLDFIKKLQNINIQKIYVRDYESEKIFKELNLNCEFLPDIGLTLKPTENTVEKFCLVNMNSYIFNGLFSDNVSDFLLSHKNIKHIAEFLDWLIYFNWKIKIIPLQTNKFFDDRIINGFLYSIVKNKNNTEIIFENLNQNQIISEFSKAELIISTKFHSTVLAHAFNKKFIDITHHDKNLNYLKDNNLMKHSLDYYELNKAKMIETLINIESEKQTLNDCKKYISKWEKLDIL